MTDERSLSEKYQVDADGFLLDSAQWDREYALKLAERVGVRGGLTREHWDIINFIRTAYSETGKCPLVYEACRMSGIALKDLKRLFPTGYLRGACKLAGITYREGYLSQSNLPPTGEDLNVIAANKMYKVDVRGFLMNPDEWDEYYAAFRAHDMKIPGGRLSPEHWRVIRFLRETFARKKEVPTVYETCDACNIDLEQLEELFPDGYHRGAVKVAGLRVR